MSRLPSLGHYDQVPDATPLARSERNAARGGSASYPPVIAGPGCWCGEPMRHPWPAKADGAPHPRAGRYGGGL